jgi:hypothetical protein
MYSFTTWVRGYGLICIIGCIVTLILVEKKYKKDLAVLICFIWSVIVVLPFMGVINKADHYNIKDKVWLVDYKDKKSYKDFKDVEHCVIKGYDSGFESLDDTRYYYDYFNIETNYKEISISQLLNYLKNDDKNEIFKANVELHKATVIQSLNGILKTNIDNGNVYYSIDGHILGKDEKGQISSLANNQPVKLNIVYNKEPCKDSKNITEYKIIKAETEDTNDK